MWRICLAAVTVLAGILLLSALWLSAARHDRLRKFHALLRAKGLPTTQQELAALYPPVPEAENAFLASAEPIQRIADQGKVPALPDDTWLRLFPRGVPLEGTNATAWREARERNDASLREARTALSRPQAWNPQWTNAAAPRPAVLAAGRLLAAGAEFAAAAGRRDEAFQEVTNLLRLAWVIDREPNVTAHIQTLAARRLAFSSIEHVLNRVAFDHEQLRSLESLLATFRDGRVWVLIHLGELVAMANMDQAMQHPARFGPAGWRSCRDYLVYYLSGQASRELDWGLRRCEHLLEAASSPVAGRFQALMEDEQRAHKEFLALRRKWVPVLAGLILRAAPMLALDPIDEAAIPVAQTACAVERWRLDHEGQAPASLTALVPAYLPSLPVDLFDGQPMRYQRLPRGFKVYSVGLDGRDDGGAGRAPDATGEGDLSFVVERD